MLERILNMKLHKPVPLDNELKQQYNLTHIYRMGSNENPLGPSPKSVEAMQQYLKLVHRYPDARAQGAREALAKYYGVQPEHMAFGNGSSELIDLLMRLFCTPEDSIVSTTGSFILYKIGAMANNLQLHEVPLLDDFRFDPMAIAKKAIDTQAKLVFLANPNNPTGTYMRQNELEILLEQLKPHNIWLVMDEAYYEYATASDYPNAVKLLPRYPHLLILRTCSKINALAGLRFGTLIGPIEVLAGINRLRSPFNTNTLAQVAVEAAVQDTEFLERTRQHTIKGREFLYQQFCKLGFKAWPSQANFVLFDAQQDANHMFVNFLKQGFVLRSAAPSALRTHVRVSVGLEAENQAFVDALARSRKSVDQ